MNQHQQPAAADNRHTSQPHPPARERWPAFYDKIRAGLIEAQCALHSGRAGRASELMDELLRAAARCDKLVMKDV